jgi:hypothetical protein
MKPGEPKAGRNIEAVDAGSGSDLRALTLYEKLGIDTVALKAAGRRTLGGVGSTGRGTRAWARRSTWKAMGTSVRLTRNSWT